ncbi:MAG: glycosyltransferase family 9 protein [Lentisphaeria bacterium]|nr:glycosyltransferase family 9 protein [Lentisphaeria bacterium]
MGREQETEKTLPVREIAYIALTPLGDVICCMNQLEHLKKIYAPCRITVFAIPLIAELMKNSAWVDEVAVLKGGVHGDLDLSGFTAPETEFDVVFNLAYHPVYLELQKKLKCKVRYGSECSFITEEMCRENFDKWVTQEYWDNVTLKKYRTVCEQMAEPIRLVDPEFNYVYPTLTPKTYRLETYPGRLPKKFVLFLPGTSWIGKYWPIAKYLAVARTLKAAGVEAVFAIGPQDRLLVPELEKCGCPVLDTLPFAQLADVVNRAELIIGNDSGPMHFAAAFHRKTIHIIASGSAFNWYPYEEPVHSLIMPSCASEEKCDSCRKTCIGRITVKQVVRKLFEKLGLAQPPIRQVAFMMQDRIGDSLVNINNIEEAVKYYAPCEITVFESKGMLSFFQAYSFADHCVEYCGEKTILPEREYDAVFNYRYDGESAGLIRKMKYRKAYGYENVDIPEKVCREVYNGGWLPLTMWDNVQLRYYTSVTEQGAGLFRLAEKDYHCQYPVLAENQLMIDFERLGGYDFPRNGVMLAVGGSYRGKNWGLANYLKLAEELKAAGREPYFLLGPEETDFLPEIRKKDWKYAVEASLSDIAGLAVKYGKDSVFAVGNDTGIMHLLKMLDCRTLTLSAADSHLTWHPYDQNRHPVMYADCSDFQNCRGCRSRNCLERLEYACVKRMTMKINSMTERK